MLARPRLPSGNGVLTVTLPRKEKAETRKRITIKAQ